MRNVKRNGTDEYGESDANDNRAMPYRPMDDMSITSCNPSDELVDVSEHEGVDLSVVQFQTKHTGAHHRHKGKRAGGGDNHDD